jgi:hypothetical protein
MWGPSHPNASQGEIRLCDFGASSSGHCGFSFQYELRLVRSHVTETASVNESGKYRRSSIASGDGHHGRFGRACDFENWPTYRTTGIRNAG